MSRGRCPETGKGGDRWAHKTELIFEKSPKTLRRFHEWGAIGKARRERVCVCNALAPSVSSPFRAHKPPLSDHFN